jgi:hypothetical protein
MALWSASGSLENMETSDGVLVMRAIADGVQPNSARIPAGFGNGIAELLDGRHRNPR